MTGRPHTLALLVPGLVCLGIAAAAGVQMYEGLMGDLYWTPLESAPDLDEAQGEVEVWLDGDLLQRRAEAGEIRDSRGRPIGVDRIRVRLNRSARVQRGQLAIVAAAGGAGVAFLLSALVAARRRSRAPGPDQ